MKSTKLKKAIAILIAVLLFPVCTGKAGAQTGGGRTVNNVAELKNYLDSQPANGPDKPIKVAMNANNLAFKDIAKAIQSSGKYVSLDLSGSPITTIPEGAFDIYEDSEGEACEMLVGIIIPNSVTRIGDATFQGCTSLASITIPNNVASIGRGAFWDCALTSVTFQGTIASGNFGGISINKNRNGVLVFLSPFDGDLRDKYLAGGRGTYTRPNGESETWTKH
jgi:hypothetical protein